MDENTNEVTESTETNGKKDQIVFDINLHEDYTGTRVFTDKRFPGGRVRIYLPAPTLEIDEDTNKSFMDMYNKDVQTLLNAGIVQNAYGERDWDNLKYAGKKASECSDEDVLANIQKSTDQGGVGPLDAEDIEDNLRDFFEVACYTEKKERTSDATKVVAKKLKSAGITDLSQEEIDAIIAKRAAETEAA